MMGPIEATLYHQQPRTRGLKRSPVTSCPAIDTSLVVEEGMLLRLGNHAGNREQEGNGFAAMCVGLFGSAGAILSAK